MNIKYLIPVMFSAFAMQALADDCNVTVDSNDAMKFDKSEIVIDKSCKEFTVNLTHSGKIAKNVMGHNIVITTTEDARAVANDGIAAGLNNQYVKPEDERVVAFTDIIGGGEKTSVTFKVDKLKTDKAYTFFCSFPGHIALMKGTVTLK
ncbi:MULTISPECIES: azurin [unclassified Cellvibrio]|uniref:azurin n=1 Tax=unclassified Cellvibrio TaxID=2624793 RepID=UPI0021C3264B|nr:azurin [Cellvibrio sp. QJXJ]UUA75009.1 azurin [Cellvibrio sp. QJXJ]HSC67922.1 azurin [Cellvibrio sp.]